MKMKRFQRLLVALLSLSLMFSLASAALAASGERTSRPVLLTVSAGPADDPALGRAMEAAERTLRRAYPKYEFRRVIFQDAASDADPLPQALDQLVTDGARDVVLVPLMLSEGEDYRALVTLAREREEDFASLWVTPPLITGQSNTALALALIPELQRWERPGTAAVLVPALGEDPQALELLQAAISAEGHSLCLVADGEDMEAVADKLAKLQVKRALLVPLAPGADEETLKALDPWQKGLEEAGYVTEIVAQGLGDCSSVREILVSGVKKARSAGEVLAALPEMESEPESVREPELRDAEAAEEPESIETQTEEPLDGENTALPAPEEEIAPPETENAPPEESEDAVYSEEPEEREDPEAPALPEETEQENSVPEPEDAEPAGDAPETEEPAGETEPAGIRGEDLAAGIWPIRALSSSSRFTVKDAQLCVAGGRMLVVLTLEGHAYGELYAGTAAQAEDAPEEELIPFQWDEEGNMRFTLPLESLDTELKLAAWSIRRGCWLDRLLIFDSASLPGSAFAVTQK